jgi:hypothetical protein
MRFQFIIALVVAKYILHSTLYLSTFLQYTECDLLEAIKESKTVIEMLRAERQDESVWGFGMPLPTQPLTGMKM